MSYSPFRHVGSIFWKHNPIHLTLFLTKRCNARCPFCFYLSADNYASAEAAELTLEEIEKVSSSMGNLLWLALSGGELFLRKDLYEIVKVFYAQNKPAIILMPTNGLLTDVIRTRAEEILQHCKNSVVTIKLSLDGPEEVHDAIRGVKGSFRKMMETYRALGELIDKYPNFELGINSVFCSINQDYMDEILQIVGSLDKIKTHTVSLIRGDVSDGALKEVDTEKYNRLIEQMATDLRNKKAPTYRFKGARLKAAQDIVQRRLIYETQVKNKQIIPCYAGKLNIVITEDGDVYPCESFTPKMKLGNIRKDGYDIKEMLKTTQAREVVRSIRETGCFCTHECYFMINILFNPTMYPALLKEYVKI
ncbi:Radical SAM domain protein [hydrothermal vent metagenome]|uniref:Radical SAM domain protein n=1 Tax=hydrothermal vent metagenome TaxID=652676 RepID=A0A3B1DYB1_9ZZZZ